jgi:hypothetical protein
MESWLIGAEKHENYSGWGSLNWQQQFIFNVLPYFSADVTLAIEAIN